MRRLIVLLIWGVAFPVAGEPVLSFEESVQTATQNNADLRNARANQEAAEHRVRAAYSGYLPQVSANAGYTDTSLGTESYSTNVTATQNLFSGFQDEARVQQAQANLEVAQQSLTAAKATLSRDLKGAYAGLLYAQNNVTLTENILRRLEENLRLVELKYEGGRENKGSYLLTRASVAQGRLDHLQARQDLASARAQLARVLGGTAERLRVASAVPVTEPLTVTDSDFSALIEATPDVRSAVAREKGADADVRLARSGLYPSLNVSGGTTRQDDKWYPDNRSNSVSASVSIPIYSGGRDWYGTRAAVAALDAAKASRESVEQQTLVRLRQTYAAYVESVERLKVDREFLDAAETRASIARARYQNGLVSFDEWDRAENDLILRQKAYLASQRDRVNAEAAWELAQGKGIIP